MRVRDYATEGSTVNLRIEAVPAGGDTKKDSVSFPMTVTALSEGDIDVDVMQPSDVTVTATPAAHTIEPGKKLWIPFEVTIPADKKVPIEVVYHYGLLAIKLGLMFQTYLC